MIRPWYAFYPGDYANDTAHLTLTEHGAYRLLLDHYYMTAKPLSANAEQLLRVCRAFAKPDADALLSVLQTFFVLKKDGYHHKRVDQELAKAQELSEKRRDAAKKGVDQRRANAEQMLSNSPAIATTTHSHSIQEQEQEQLQKKEERQGPRKKGLRGHRWPPDAVVPQEWIEDAMVARREAKLPLVDLTAEAVAFPHYWASATGASAAKVDWRRAFINRALSPYVGKGFANGRSNGQLGKSDHPLGQFGEALERERARVTFTEDD